MPHLITRKTIAVQTPSNPFFQSPNIDIPEKVRHTILTAQQYDPSHPSGPTNIEPSYVTSKREHPLENTRYLKIRNQLDIAPYIVPEFNEQYLSFKENPDFQYIKKLGSLTHKTENCVGISNKKGGLSAITTILVENLILVRFSGPLAIGAHTDSELTDRASVAGPHGPYFIIFEDTNIPTINTHRGPIFIAKIQHMHAILVPDNNSKNVITIALTNAKRLGLITDQHLTQVQTKLHTYETYKHFLETLPSPIHSSSPQIAEPHPSLPPQLVNYGVTNSTTVKPGPLSFITND